MKSGSGCHFLKELVATRPDQSDIASEILGTGPIDTADLAEIMEGSSDEVLTQIQSLVSVFRVKDPIEAASRLTESGVRASHVHGLGHMNHIAYMPEPPELTGSVRSLFRLAHVRFAPNRFERIRS